MATGGFLFLVSMRLPLNDIEKLWVEDDIVDILGAKVVLKKPNQPNILKILRGRNINNDKNLPSKAQ